MSRNFARGEPPPRGSIEWVGVGDMFDPEPPTTSGFQVFEVGFTDLDAADRWMKNLGENIRYSRQVHGDKVLTKSDVAEWDDLTARWVPFRQKLTSAVKSPGWVQMMLRENKSQFDSLLNESKRLHDRLVAKGMSVVAVPYMGEMVVLLRTLPKTMRPPEMRAKLEAGVRCGEKMRDENTPWWSWRRSSDARGLSQAIAAARSAAELLARSRTSDAYERGSPVYDEFLRRLTRIYVEAAGLYGVTETRRTAVAEALDAARSAGTKEEGRLLWLLALAGIGYLGIRWLSSSNSTATVKVPDAYPAT